MSTREGPRAFLTLRSMVALCVAGHALATGLATADTFGRRASVQEIAAYDIEVRPDGQGLPDGSGTVKQGAAVYAAQCAGCHGATGVEGPRDKLVGGLGTLASNMPVKTVGSYWQYAPTVFDYVNRAMPFTAPGSLTPDEVYSVVAFLLNRNGIVEEDAVVDRTSLPLVKMPNRDGFIVEPKFRRSRRRP